MGGGVSISKFITSVISWATLNWPPPSWPSLCYQVGAYHSSLKTTQGIFILENLLIILWLQALHDYEHP